MWLVLRRPIALALLLGCAISMLTARRLTVRLILDGALSYAFVPLFQIAAFAIVFRPQSAPIAFSDAVDRFFAGSLPWLLWLAALTTAAAMSWSVYWPLAWLEISAIAPIVWAGHIDYHFYRDVLRRGRGGAMRDLVLQRALAWSAVLAYFLGIAIRDDVWPLMRRWAGL